MGASEFTRYVHVTLRALRDLDDDGNPKVKMVPVKIQLDAPLTRS